MIYFIIEIKSLLESMESQLSRFAQRDLLREAITRDLGCAVLRLPDVLSANLSFPLNSVSELTLSEIEAASTVVTEVLRAKDKVSARQCKYSGMDDVMRAAEIWNHDVTNGCASSMVQFREWNQDLNVDNVNNFFLAATNVKLFGSSMAYLASGGKEKFSLPVPLDRMQYLLPGAVGSYELRKMTLEEIEQGTIRSPEYVSLCQLAKNAGRNALVNKTAGFFVSSRREQDYVVLSVRDQGTGILDGEGNPLAIEKLPGIFGSYSTKKNGGLGLQIVLNSIQLRGGHIKVVTTTDTGPTLCYDTREHHASKGLERRERGTEFSLYIPRL